MYCHVYGGLLYDVFQYVTDFRDISCFAEKISKLASYFTKKCDLILMKLVQCRPLIISGAH